MKLLQLLLFAISVLLLSSSLNAQILIGMNEDEIVEYMEENHPDFNLNTGFGATETTVKFIDTVKDRTMIFFLDDNKICKYSKLILDIEEYDKTIAALDKSYESAGEMKWEVSKEEGKYFLSIEKTDWMFSIVTQKAD